MDLIDKLSDLAARIKRQYDHVKTEEAVKTSFILPFIQSLGYDVFNPQEIIPELTADHGVKKGEKVDYAIQLDGKIQVLIECKQLDAPLEAKHAGQLFRYFAVTEAKFGVLTDGVRYLFYTDLEAPNKMDEKPFFEFNLFDFTPSDVDELKKFGRQAFNVETITSTASNLKYLRSLINEIRDEFNTPSEELVKLLVGRALPGQRFTAQVKEQFTELTSRAMATYLNDAINARLKSALDPSSISVTNPAVAASVNSIADQTTDGENCEISTTEDELEGYRIIQAICAEVVDPADISIRDSKTYCAILYKDNNRNPLARLYFNNKKVSPRIGLFSPDESKSETRVEISVPRDIFKSKASILSSLNFYISAKGSKGNQ